MSRSHKSILQLALVAVLLLTGAPVIKAGNCPTVSQVTVSCAGKDQQNNCTYQFSFTLGNTSSSTVVVQQYAGGNVNFPSTTLLAGQTSNINVAVTIPCGTKIKLSLTIGPGCQQLYEYDAPSCCQFTPVPANPILCKGGTTQVMLNGLPANFSGTIQWYYSSPCTTGAPPPAPPWIAIGSNSNTVQTPALSQTTCFAAIVTSTGGCQGSIVSSSATVNVVNPGTGSITCSGASCPTDLCNGATVNLGYSNPGADPGCKLQWEKWNAVTSQWQAIPGQTSPALQTQTVNSTTCPFEAIKFRVNASCPQCGSTFTEVDFNVYAPTNPGSIHAAPASQNSVCQGKGTVLVASGQCGNVVTWSSSPSGAPGTFTPIQGSQGALAWNTNPLSQDTWYQVQIQNGPCGNPIPSLPFKVTVKPKPTVSLAPANPAPVCRPNKIQLTAAGAPAGGIYKWYLNGVLAPNPNSGPTYQAAVSGNYYVVYTTPCGTAKSSPVTVTISRPVAVISGACGICQTPPGQSITLQALATGGVAPYQIDWTGPNGYIGSGSSITVSPTATATYSIAVTDAIGCSTIVSHKVNVCPP
jgi:hypothetical protein